MPKYTNLDIAAWFIRKEKMNHEKLQCLLYLAYAWYEALYLQALFITQGFEALPIMPCEPDILSRYHIYGMKKIQFIQGQTIDSATNEFLMSVYATYGMVDGEVLCSYLRKSEPYLKARQRQESYQITKEDMRAYYEQQSKH